MYEAYTLSDQVWTPQLPAHWEFQRAKCIFDSPKEKNEGNKESNVLSLTLKGVIHNSKENPIGLSPADYATYQIFEANDLVFKLIDLENVSTSRVGIVPERGIMSSAYIRFSARKEINVRYFYYQYHDWWLRQIFNGLGAGVRQTLSAQDLLNLKLAVPPRKEQDQIVRYLDWQVSKINHLIHGYQKQINLLDERKTTVINQAVTHGIHADVEMQAVEANWVKEIPAHWQFNKVKQHFEIKKRIAGKEGYDVISITQQGLKVKDIASNEGQMAANYSKYQFVYPGDYAMNHMDLLTGFIGLSDIFGVTSPDYRVFSAIDVERTDLKYFLYVFQLGYKRKIFYGLGRGAANKGRWRMPAINFKNYDIPVPPIEEQHEIVEYIEQETEKIDLLKREVEKQIEYLREYRTRLISDVVTGQIDVRDVVIPEYTPEADTEIDTDDIGEDAEEVAEDAE